MSAKDIYHNAVKTSLIKDGWTITDEPLYLKLGTRNAAVDLGAEKLIAAQRGVHKIAVEIESFIGASFLNDLEKAWGQFFLYAPSSRMVRYALLIHPTGLYAAVISLWYNYSLFIIHYSLFTIHYSLFTIHYSLFTIHYSLFTIHYQTILANK